MDTNRFESHYPATAREEEIRKILTYVKEGNACQLVGIPGSGKAIIYKLLVYNRAVREHHLGKEQDNYHFVLADLAEVKEKPMSEITKFLFLSLVDSLRERKMDEVYAATNSIFKESLAMHDEMVMFQGLKHAVDYVTAEKGLTIVYLFSNFFEYIPYLSNTFFTNLGVLKARAKYHFSAVFSLHYPLEQVVDAVVFADMYKLLAGHIVYVRRFDVVSSQFQVRYLEDALGKKLPEKAKKEIMVLTGGLSRMTNVAVEEVLHGDTPMSSWPSFEDLRLVQDRKRGDSGLAKARQNDELVHFLEDSRAVRSVSYAIWEALRPQDQHVLKELVKGNKTSHDIMVLDYLEQVGLVEKQAIDLPLFASFVRYRSKHGIRDRITYKAESNALYKGEMELTEGLTASEFKLLKYCIEHANQVIERDELIQAIWSDGKSTAGVTDQALDQLIFRLRHKIEETPDQPQHLLTVKGRGIKFVP